MTSVWLGWQVPDRVTLRASVTSCISVLRSLDSMLVKALPGLLGQLPVWGGDTHTACGNLHEIELY